MEYLTLLASYGLWAAVWYAGVAYPILWVRREYTIRIVVRHRKAHA